MISFQDLGLSAGLLRGVTELGYVTPTPIQEQVIEAMFTHDKDIVALAKTGTGKTAAFGLPIVDRVNLGAREIQALILAPTRELCIQICKDIIGYSAFVDDIDILPVYGGEDIEKQLRRLKRPPQILVATPGRLVDLINRRALNLSTVKFLVLDEADEMLNMGFQEDLTYIIEQTPKTKRTLLLSATMPKEVDRIAKKYMKESVRLAVAGQESGGTSEDVSHEYIVVHARDRYDALKRVLDVNSSAYAIIFCRTRNDATDLANKLHRDGYSADALTGELQQRKRDQVMENFRSKRLHFLVATDVAARGIDVNDLTHVINIGVPEANETYTHRSGRTGRAGKKGISLSIINMHERQGIRQLERALNKPFEQRQVPGTNEIVSRRIEAFVEEIKAQIGQLEGNEALIESASEALKHLDRKALIARFLHREFKELIDTHSNDRDLNEGVNSSSSGYGDRDRGGSGRRSGGGYGDRGGSGSGYGGGGRRSGGFTDRNDSRGRDDRKSSGGAGASGGSSGGFFDRKKKAAGEKPFGKFAKKKSAKY